MTQILTPTRKVSSRAVSATIAVGSAVWALFLVATAVAVVAGRSLLGWAPLTVDGLPQAVPGVLPGGPLVLDVIGPWLRVLTAAPSLILAATAVLTGWYTVGLVRALQQEPFAQGTLTLVKRLSWTLVLGSLVAGLADTAAVVGLGEARGTGDEWNMFIDLPSWPLGLTLAGLLVAALGWGLHRGAGLEEELAHVV